MFKLNGFKKLIINLETFKLCNDKNYTKIIFYKG